MLKQLDDIPSFLIQSPYPYKDRKRTEGIYGVTEIFYCLRKSVLARVVPTPTALTLLTRRRFSRGSNLEKAFFGDAQNPVHFRGPKNLDGRDFSKTEGHTDHSCLNDQGEKTIIEFKTTKRLWYKGPDGKNFYSLKAARAALPKEQWKLVERCPQDSHLDQLKLYMLLTESIHGYLIYYELSTDNNYVWSIDAEDISEEFKNEMKDRLDTLDRAFTEDVMPPKCPKFSFECGLCNFGDTKNGICKLCDVELFNIGDFVNEFKSKKDPFSFMPLVKQYYDKFGMDSSGLEMLRDDSMNGEKTNGNK